MNTWFSQNKCGILGVITKTKMTQNKKTSTTQSIPKGNGIEIENKVSASQKESKWGNNVTQLGLSSPATGGQFWCLDVVITRSPMLISMCIDMSEGVLSSFLHWKFAHCINSSYFSTSFFKVSITEDRFCFCVSIVFFSTNLKCLNEK